MSHETREPVRVRLSANQPAEFLARVVGWGGQILVEGDVLSLSYTLYELSSAGRVRTPVDNHTNVDCNVADTFDPVVDDSRWTKDNTGYNFHHTPDLEDYEAWSKPGKDYLLEYTIVPAVDAEQNIKVAFLLEVI